MKKREKQDTGKSCLPFCLHHFVEADRHRKRERKRGIFQQKCCRVGGWNKKIQQNFQKHGL